MTKFFNLKERLDKYQGLRLVLGECLCFFVGFYFSSIRFIFGTYPFALAFICSCGSLTVFAFCGGLLSCVFVQGFNVPHMIALSAALGLRVICSLIQKREGGSIILGKSASKTALELLFYENTSVRVAISCFVALGYGIYSIILSSYSFFEIFACLFYVAVCGIFTLALSSRTEGKRAYAFYLATSFIVLYGIRALELFGLNVALILICGITLYVSKHLGAYKSCTVGALLGLCLGAAYVPCIAILGLASGFLWKGSSYFAVMSAFLLSFAYGIYAQGYNAIIYLAPGMLFACLVTYSCLKLELLPAPRALSSRADELEAYLLQEQIGNARGRIGNLRSTLSDVSQMLRDVASKSKIPTKQDMAGICLESCEEHCFGCPKHSICWEKDIATTHEALDMLTEKSYESGAVSAKDACERFMHRCPNIERIVLQINTKIKENLTQGVKNDKLDACSGDYELISKMLLCASEDAFDTELSSSSDEQRLRRAGARVGLRFDKITVLGIKSKKIIIYGVDTERSKCSQEKLKEAFEEALSIKLTDPKIIQDNGVTILTMQTRRIFSAGAHTEAVVCKGEKINGDSTLSFEHEDRFYSVLCDGMGSGQSARLTSLLATTLLQRLISGGVDKESALCALNNFIRAKNGECTCTVDLLELDLQSGSGRLLKSGAAPSFIKRGDGVFKLESKTLPIGIMKTLDAKLLSFEIRSGDALIMLSDGVVCDETDSAYLAKHLKEADTADKKRLCSEILEKMSKRHEKSDDMTAVCVVVA